MVSNQNIGSCEKFVVRYNIGYKAGSQFQMSNIIEDFLYPIFSNIIYNIKISILPLLSFPDLTLDFKEIDVIFGCKKAE